MSQLRSVLSAVLVLMAASACTREERTLAVNGNLTVTRQSGAETQTLEVGSRLPDSQLSPQAFQDAWDAAFNGKDIGTGLALSTGGGADEVAGKAPLIGLMVVLPTPLTKGSVIPVSGTLRAPTTMPLYWTTFGPHDVLAADWALVALRLFDYRPVGLVVERDFLATWASGTIEVVSFGGDQLTLELNITARNDLGEVVHLTGPFTVRGEKYRPPYFS